MKTAHDLVTLAKSCIKEVSLSDAPQAIQNADILLDVREADEYASGHTLALFICLEACLNLN